MSAAVRSSVPLDLDGTFHPAARSRGKVVRAPLPKFPTVYCVGASSCMGAGYLRPTAAQFFPRQNNAANYQSRQHPAGNRNPIGISQRWPRSCGHRRQPHTSISSLKPQNEPVALGHPAKPAPHPKPWSPCSDPPRDRASSRTSCAGQLSLGGAIIRLAKSVSPQSCALTRKSNNSNSASNAGAK